MAKTSLIRIVVPDRSTSAHLQSLSFQYTVTVMLGDILGYTIQLHWLCGSVLGLVGVIATNIFRRRNIANSGRYASTLFPVSSTTFTSTHSATTQVLGIALQVVYHTRYQFSKGMQRTVLQLYMSSMEMLSASLRTHCLTYQPELGQVHQ